MARRNKVFEGKTTILYDGPEPGTLIQYFKDDSHPEAVASMVEGKGVINNRVSEFLMSGLHDVGVPTHLIKRMNMREQLVRMTEAIPLQITVRNFAAGSLSERLGIPFGTPLPRPIVEYAYKDDKDTLPMVSEEHILAFGWATHQDLDDAVAMALRINDFLFGMMLAVGVRLADFRLELGRIWDGDFARLIVTDELSPENCRLWDMRGVTDRTDGQAIAAPGPLLDASAELARRLGIMPSHVTHNLRKGAMN